MSSASRRRPPARPSAVPPLRDRRSFRSRSLRTLAVLLLFVLAVLVWQALRTRDWLPAQATVAQVETQVAPFFDLRRVGIHFGRQRRESFTYRYQVGARSYDGHEDGVPSASRLVVYYDPAEPSSSIVGRPRIGPVLAAAAAGVALLAVAFVVAGRAGRRGGGSG